MNPILVKKVIIDKTLSVLQEAGARRIERVLLWLVPLKGNSTEVSEIFIPLQVAKMDYFHIPREGVALTLRHLKEKKLKAVAQVHSHPKEAFHSDADDRWAIINHVGAMSLVLPYFALHTSPQTFVQHAVVFEMSIAKKWEEVFPQAVRNRYRTIP